MDKPDQVVKFSILYDDFAGLSLDEEFAKIQKTYQHIIDNPHPTLAKVYSFGELYRGSVEIFEWEQVYVLYYSIMEKLIPLSEQEQKVFKTICSIHNNELEARPIETILSELKEWFDVDKEKILAFYNSLSSLDIDHKDVKTDNIMKDNTNFKLVDFDRVEQKEKSNDKDKN